MRYALLTLATLVGLAVAAPPAQAQLAVELRGSLNNAIGDFGDDGGGEATSDAGLGAGLIYNLSPNLSVYGGYARDMFGCEGCGDDDGYTSSGFEGGVKLLAAREQGILPWIRGGFVAHELELEDEGFSTESDMSLGFQVAGGVDIPLGEVLSFSPSLRYQNYNADFDLVSGDFITAETSVEYLALDLALHIHMSGLGSR